MTDSLTNEILTIDGSLMEGGGQVLRNVVAFSCIMKKPLKIENIRASRDKPGLRPQHVTGLRLLRDIYHAKLSGDEVGSNTIIFEPNNIAVEKTTFLADAKTAGSITLMIQISLPPLIFLALPPKSAFSPPPPAVNIILKGGTSGKAAPTIDFVIEVFKPIVERHFGLAFDVNIIGRGYYPKGGGEVILRVQPLVGKALTPITLLERGHLVSIKGRATIANSANQVAQKMIRSATRILNEANLKGEDNITQINPRIEINYEKIASGKGFEIILWAETSTGCILAGSGVYDRDANFKLDLSPEQLGENAAKELISNLRQGGCVDENLQDQLIIFMALARGKSQLLIGEPTLHTRTAIHYAQIMTGVRFEVSKFSNNDNSTAVSSNIIEQGQEDSHELYLIECEGIGLVAAGPKINEG
ncbi:11504_t:CDS:10 [Ambispora leptoticha]|uniref:RNA 3'-terminal-phosphate cyclase (ATP) n=1 Tax=Ambispora leptoticha TaxID=144679 RepID=A0A9N9BE26_9GLOM|nr:11504_t:CDS:10 [Ambispora leptoticha]